MPYHFDRRFPPLFSKGDHNGDPTTVPLDARSQVIGTAEWNESVEHHDHGSGFHAPPTLTYSEYNATRLMRWSWEVPITYCIEDVKVTEKYTLGYSKTQSRKIETSLGLKMSGGLKGMFNSDVSASLKINEEVSQTWRLEYSKTIEQQYKKSNTYIKWYLEDVLIIERKSKVRRLDERNRWFNPTRVQESISSIVNVRPEGFILDYAQTGKIMEVISSETFTFSECYNAVCDGVHNGSIGWVGPDRDTYEEAQVDCDDHLSEYPDHDCAVVKN